LDGHLTIDITGMPSGFGLLAKEYCNIRLRLQVLESANGFYIGTFDINEGPISRESNEYFSSLEQADSALKTGAWTQKEYP